MNNDMQNDNPLVEKSDIKKSGIDWILIIRKVWEIRTKLIKAAILGTIVALIISFSIPKQYSVTVTLSPESTGRSEASGLASFASSFLGAGIGKRGSDALNTLMAPEIVTSTPFLLEMLKVRVVSEKEKIDTTLMSYLANESLPWWTHVLRSPSYIIHGVLSLVFSNDSGSNKVEPQQNDGPIKLSLGEASQLGKLRGKILATVDKKSGMITINVKLQDPEITAIVTDSVLGKLQKYIADYKTSKAQEDCNYWTRLYHDSKEKYFEAQNNYAIYEDANNNVVSHSTMLEKERLQNEVTLAFQAYNQVAQQLQLARAKVQEEKPVFTVIEPSVVPLGPLQKSKILLIIEFILLFTTVVIGWNFFVLPLKLRIREIIRPIK